MPLTDVMQKTTYRQYTAWMEWLRNQWNEPSRTDYYLMKLINLVRAFYGMFAGLKTIPPVDKEKIEFKFSDTASANASTAPDPMKLKMAHAMLQARLGIKVEGTKVTQVVKGKQDGQRS